MMRGALSGRRSAALGAGLLAGAVLTGCAADQTPTAPAAATGPVETSSAPAPDPDSGAGSDLAAGLLPAEAFGEGAEIDQLPLGDVPHVDHWGHRGHWGHGGHWGHRGHGWWDDEEGVTPTECRTAMEQAAAQFGGVEDVTGQVARTDDGVKTVQILAVQDTSGNAVEHFRAVVDACGSVSFSEDYGHGDVNGQVSVEELPDLPEGMAGVSVTFSGDYPGGSWSTTALAGIAQDGDRVLALMQTAHDHDDPDSADGDAVDPAAFTALLQRAYDVQSDALD